MSLVIILSIILLLYLHVGNRMKMQKELEKSNKFLKLKKAWL